MVRITRNAKTAGSECGDQWLTCQPIGEGVKVASTPPTVIVT